VVVPILGSQKNLSGDISPLTPELADCLLEGNAMTGGKLTLRRFSVWFNQNYGLKMLSSTLWRYFRKLGAIMRNSYMKPLLKTEHNIARLTFVLNKLEPGPDVLYWYSWYNPTTVKLKCVKGFADCSL
jgi:hypothetical protein